MTIYDLRMGIPRWICRALLGVSVCSVLALAAVRIVPQFGRDVALAREERRGDRRFRSGELQEAERCWRQVLVARPDQKTVRNKLAVVCMQAARYAEARDILEAGLLRHARESSFHYNLALLAYMQNDFEAALSALDKVLAINPYHGEVHYIKGMILEAQGKHELAQEEFIRELNVDPATPEAWVKLGVLPPGSRMRSWIQR